MYKSSLDPRSPTTTPPPSSADSEASGLNMWFGTQVLNSFDLHIKFQTSGSLSHQSSFSLASDGDETQPWDGQPAEGVEGVPEDPAASVAPAEAPEEAPEPAEEFTGSEPEEVGVDMLGKIIK